MVASGEKPAYGYRRVAWWLRRKEGLHVNHKRVLRVMRERGLLVRSRQSAGAAKERMGSRGSRRAQSDLAVGHDENLGRPGHALGVSSERDRLLHAGDRGLESLEPLPNRRRAGSGGTGGVESASRRKPGSTLDTDHRQRDAVHFLAVLRNTGAARDHTSPHGLSSRRATATSNGSIAA